VILFSKKDTRSILLLRALEESSSSSSFRYASLSQSVSQLIHRERSSTVVMVQLVIRVTVHSS
jgi:hypothetical protein